MPLEQDRLAQRQATACILLQPGIKIKPECRADSLANLSKRLLAVAQSHEIEEHGKGLCSSKVWWAMQGNKH